MSMIKPVGERRRGPWLGGAQTRPTRRESDPEPLFDPEPEPEHALERSGASGWNKALAACGLALIFAAGLGAGLSIGWSGSKGAGAPSASAAR